jgi:hypothetical protein
MDEEDRCRIHSVSPNGCSHFDGRQTTNPTLLFVRNNVWNAGLTYKTEFKNDRRSGSSLMDSMLKCVLDSKDEAELGRLLDELSILKTLYAL